MVSKLLFRSPAKFALEISYGVVKVSWQIFFKLVWALLVVPSTTKSLVPSWFQCKSSGFTKAPFTLPHLERTYISAATLESLDVTPSRLKFVLKLYSVTLSLALPWNPSFFRREERRYILLPSLLKVTPVALRDQCISKALTYVGFAKAFISKNEHENSKMIKVLIIKKS